MKNVLTVEKLMRVLEAFEPDTEIWVGHSGGKGKRFKVNYANDIRPPGHFGPNDSFLAIMYTEPES